MFILIVVLLLLLGLITLIVVYLLNKIQKIVIFNNKIKYESNDSIKHIFKKYGTVIELDLINEMGNNGNYLLLVETPWSINNNNYMLFNGKYFILDKGYYYFYSKQSKLFKSNKNTKILILDIIKYSNKIKVIK